MKCHFQFHESCQFDLPLALGQIHNLVYSHQVGHHQGSGRHGTPQPLGHCWQVNSLQYILHYFPGGLGFLYVLIILSKLALNCLLLKPPQLELGAIVLPPERLSIQGLQMKFDLAIYLQGVVLIH